LDAEENLRQAQYDLRAPIKLSAVPEYRQALY